MSGAYGGAEPTRPRGPEAPGPDEDAKPRGMTPGEFDAWNALGKAAGLIMKLPVMHPQQRLEDSAAIHVLQERLLARPTYRAYLRDSGLDPYGWWDRSDEYLARHIHVGDTAPATRTVG